MELACQNCGEKQVVQGFLAAAQQACGKCGRLMMGELSGGSRTARPAGFGEESVAAGYYSPGGSSTLRLWVGVALGAAAGVGLVVAVSKMGAIPRPQLGAILGALAGVVLAPVLAFSGLISSIIFPISLEGLLGDSLWNRLATALHEHRIRPLFLPLLIYLVLPMTACAYGGSRMANPAILMWAAGLGGVLLGAILGGIAGTLIGKGHSAQ